MTRAALAALLCITGCATAQSAPEPPPRDDLAAAWPTESLQHCYRNYVATFGGVVDGEKLSSTRGPTVAGETPWQGSVSFSVGLSPQSAPEVVFDERPDDTLAGCWRDALSESAAWPEVRSEVEVERTVEFTLD